MQEFLPTIRNDKGCRDFRIYRDMENGEIFFLSVHWEAQASLRDYLRSSDGMAFLGAIDMLREKAEVKFRQNERWEEIDTLKRIRNKT